MRLRFDRDEDRRWRQINAPVTDATTSGSFLVIDLSGSSSRIEYRAAAADDPGRRKPDITLAERALDWSPRVSLTDGLARTIGYFAEALNKPKHFNQIPAARRKAANQPAGRH